MHSWEGKKLDFTLKRHLPKRSFPNQPSLYKSIIARSIKATAGKVSAQSLKRHQSSPWALTSKSLSRRLTCWARHLTGMDGVQQFCFYLLADFFFFGPWVLWCVREPQLQVSPGTLGPWHLGYALLTAPTNNAAEMLPTQCMGQWKRKAWITNPPPNTRLSTVWPQVDHSNTSSNKETWIIWVTYNTSTSISLGPMRLEI